MKTDLSIVIVSYNTRMLLAQCLDSIIKETPSLVFEIIVVDNNSEDGTQEMLARTFPQVKVLVNKENWGFAAANNRGIQAAIGDYVLLLNPDTVILHGAIEKTFEFLSSHTKAGIVGCKLWFPDGSLQRSVRSFPNVWNVFCEATFLYLVPWFKWTSQFTLSNVDYNSERTVDWVCGAYMMMRRELVDRIGFLDEQFYMYTEEVDYCFRAWQAEYEVWFIPQAEVIHHWAGVSNPSRRAFIWSNLSQMLFFQKHFSGLKKYAVISLKYAGIVLRIPVYFIAGVLSFNKKLIAKASYSMDTAYRLVATPLKYHHNFTGRVMPWK